MARTRDSLQFSPERGWRLRRSAVVGAVILLMGGCSQVPESAVTPTHPSNAAVSSSNAPRPVRPVDPEVRAAQESLADLGYYQGPIDGIDGPRTRAAVARYQTNQMIPPDGRISRDLVAQLAGQPAMDGEHDGIDFAAGPLYEPGDIYTYSDGQIETVLSVSERRVYWQDARGLRWSADPDFTLPTGRSSTHAEIAVEQSLSWPLRVGATSSYTVETTRGNRATANHNAAEHWRCAVEGRERVSVRAGTLDSYKIVCRRDGIGATQARTWYYAPAVGHYVRYIDGAAAPANGITGTRSRDLVAVSPGASGWPAEARTGLAWAVHHALESEPDGQPVPWESSAVAARFVIRAGARVDDQCRRFSETRIGPDASKRLYPGIACRTDGGRWRLPGSDGAPLERAAS